MPEGLHFTPTQKRILAVLSDGMPHRRAELEACLNDDMATRGALNAHLGFIRKLIRPHGREILCQYLNKQFMYRQVRLLDPASD